MRIENWVPIRFEFELSLIGIIYDDPRFNKETSEFKDGHRIITSELVQASEKEVITRSGSCYQLGTKGDFEILKNHPNIVNFQITEDWEGFENLCQK